MVRAAVPEIFMQRTGTICENRAGIRSTVVAGVPAAGLRGVCTGVCSWPALGLRPPEFRERGWNSVNGPGLAGTADFAAAIVCHAAKGRQSPVFPAHG